MSQLVAALLDSSLKNSLAPSQIELLADFMELHTVASGSLVMEQGSPANFAGLMIAGEMEVIGDGVKIATLSEGTFFGEAAFSHEGTRTANVKAVGQVTYAKLRLERFDELLHAHRTIAMRSKAFFEGLYAANKDKRDGDQNRYVALIAHNAMKPVLVDFATAYRSRLEKFPLVATGTTGSLLHNATGLVLSRKVQSGPLGGDQAIGSLIASGNIQAVIFFRDPLSAHPHHADIEALGRLCDVYYVPFATNPATARAVLAQLESGTVAHFANPSVDGYVSRQSAVAQHKA